MRETLYGVPSRMLATGHLQPLATRKRARRTEAQTAKLGF